MLFKYWRLFCFPHWLRTRIWAAWFRVSHFIKCYLIFFPSSSSWSFYVRRLFCLRFSIRFWFLVEFLENVVTIYDRLCLCLCLCFNLTAGHCFMSFMHIQFASLGVFVFALVSIRFESVVYKLKCSLMTSVHFPIAFDDCVKIEVDQFGTSSMARSWISNLSYHFKIGKKENIKTSNY